MSIGLSNMETNLRLLLFSSTCPNIQFLSKSIQKNVKKVIYTYESSSLDDILSFVIAELGGRKVQSIAFILDGNGREIYLTGVGDTVSKFSAFSVEFYMDYGSKLQPIVSTAVMQLLMSDRLMNIICSKTMFAIRIVR
ncbi:hypothetical protein TNCV_187821 [Trichonephila clavipes]|nr:hypothetical protein TNCV_187821 [Trichonephila clavipes]